MTPRRQAIQERRRRVADLHRDCYSNAQIAEITGLAIHLVKSDLTAMGVSTKAEHQRMLTRAVRLMRSGRPIFEVSASCAIPLSTLVRIAAEQGISGSRTSTRQMRVKTVRAHVRARHRSICRPAPGSFLQFRRRIG